MKYRFLDVDEYGVVELIYRGLGFKKGFPTPQVAKVSVAEVDGKIVSFMVGQLISLQIGPVWVDDQYKGKVNLRRLHNMHEALMTPGARYFAFASSDLVEGLCRAGGMEEMVGWKVFRKELPDGE